MSAVEEASKSGFSSGNIAIPLPRVFGRLLLLRLLARGGMGDVYLAATTGIEGAERPCVVKTVRRDHIHDGSFLARFLDEARVQAQLNHPGVAQVLEAASDENGEPYTVVEYVEGRSLADVRQRAVQLGARVDWPEAVAFAIELGQALAHVHERSGADGSPLGIVHRDLSPQNVMIGFAGELKLIDFGTARGQNRKCHTVAGVVFAKPGYVAPEVARQEVGDSRIDVYAMGVMLWELCAGKRLLVGDAQKHLEDVAHGRFEIPELAKTRGIPRELDAVIARLTANDPDRRYASAGVAAKDLAKVLQLAPSKESGERGVRARIAGLMKTLWPSEPARSRAEFAKLLKESRHLRSEASTPSTSKVAELAAAHMSDDPAVLSGTPYRLGKKIGEGESGQVFEAEHVELGRKLAVKVLAPTHSSAQDAVERFRREARVVANLEHPNLVHLHDFGKALDGRVFLAMELLAGQTLDAYARLGSDETEKRGLGYREAVQIAVQVTRALETAHAAGLVHRDLKPQNLFVESDGNVKLLDFGVAMAVSDVAGEDTIRQKGFAIFGTPEYMAPEQVAGEPVDGRCDLYALGCVLYQLLTGSCPFEGSSGVAVMGRQLRDTPEAPTAIAKDRVIPQALEAVVMRSLAKAREDRFESAKAMREALEAALVRTDRRRGVGKFVVGLAGLASIGVLVAGGFAYVKETRAKKDFFAGASIPTVSVDALPLVSSGTDTPAPPAQSVAVEDLPKVDEPTSASPVVAHVAQAGAGHTGGKPETTEPTAKENEPAPRAPTTGVAATEAPPEPGEDAKMAAKESEEQGGASGSPAAVAELPNKAEAPAIVRRATAREREHEPSHESSAGHADRGDAAADLDAKRREAEAHPSDARALRAWAKAAYRAHDHKEARRAAREWMTHDPSAEPRIFLATVLEASGHRTEAKTVLEDWLSKHPDSGEARRMRARLGGDRKPTRR
jgi:serine/threonine-protein kinase